MWALESAPRWLPLQRITPITVPRFVIMAITPIIPTRAHPTAITVRSGSTAAYSSASAHGTAGAGVAAAGVVADTVDAAATDMRVAEPMQAADIVVPMAAEPVAMPAAEPVAMPVAEPAAMPVAELVAMPVAALAASAVAGLAASAVAAAAEATVVAADAVNPRRINQQKARLPRQTGFFFAPKPLSLSAR